MKKWNLRSYAPLLLMVSLSVVLGVLTLCGVVDLSLLPALVEDKPTLAILTALSLYALKGISGVIVYNVLVAVVSLIFPLPAALIVNGIGLAVSLSVSYCMGRRTDPSGLNALLDRHPKIKRFFAASQKLGFISCFTIHMLGLSMEVLGVLFGMMRTGYWTYLISSWLAIYPGTICFTILGNRLDLRSPVFWVFLVIDVALLLFALLYCKRRMTGSATLPDEAAKENKPDDKA